MKKILPLLLLLFCLEHKVSAQFFTYSLTIQLSNTNTPVPITVIYPDSSGAGVVSDTSHSTDQNGNLSVLFQTFFPIDSCRCEFLNCTNVLNDTTFFPDTTNYQFTWNSDFCPTNPVPDTCNVSFETSYCTCDNTFYIETDTTELGNHFVIWNFGDGDTSTQIFPTHTYNQNALYDVCIQAFDSIGGTLICNFCRQIGFDSNGNPVTRSEGNSGFNLKVGLPGTAAHQSVLSSNSISVYPNPAGDFPFLYLFSDEEKYYDIRIFNTIGEEVKFFRRSAIEGSNTYPLDLSGLSSGNYFITVKFGERLITTVFAK